MPIDLRIRDQQNSMNDHHLSMYKCTEDRVVKVFAQAEMTMLYLLTKNPEEMADLKVDDEMSQQDVHMKGRTNNI